MYLAKDQSFTFYKTNYKKKEALSTAYLSYLNFKKWKAEINAWVFQNIYIRSDAITITNQRFYLTNAFTKILNLTHSWEGEGSG